MRKLFAVILIACICISCADVSARGAETSQNYKNIPGVTSEEIAEIGALKDSGRTFSYGALLSSEAFLDNTGNLSGYTADLCRLLSGLFDIQFTPEIYGWADIVEGLENKSLDFSGDFSITPEQAQSHFMSEAIAVRSLVMFYREDEPISKIANDRLLVLGVLKDSAHLKMLVDTYSGEFTTVTFERIEDAPAALGTGEIDAFICNNVSGTIFEGGGFTYEVYSPLVFDSVALTTQNEELKSIISVFNKYIENGGRDILSSLYAAGIVNHTRSVLYKSFTDEEIAYIDSHVSGNKSVPVILESGNYPISFYNETTGEYQGIVPDLLARISALTGLQFESVNAPEEDWATVLAKLQNGEASLISELLHTPTRVGLFLWPDEPACVTHYALLSKSDAPNLEINQLLGKRLGVEEGTAYQSLATQWFPDIAMTAYASIDEAFDGLDNGEVDLIIASENLLLSQTNYNEKPGYKVNFSIDYTAESMLGFNINETVLLSIFNKSYPYVNNDIIVRNWSSRVFDYSGQLAQARVNLLLISTVLLAAFIALLAVFLIKNNRHRNNLSSLVKARTVQLAEKTAALSTVYNTIPDLLYSKDLEGKYTSCNDSFEAYAGVLEKELLGKTSSEILLNISPDELELQNAQDREVMEKDTSTVVEHLVTYPNGEQRLLETIKTSLRQNDKVVGMIGISRDITSHKASQEAALAASKAKGSFLARMSHEIRTPLNAIIGMAEITKNSIGNTEKTMSSINQIVISSHHLLSLINNVLDMSKIESGSLDVFNQSLYLQEALEETIAIVSSRCLEKNITFENNVSMLPNIVIMSDKLRLNQVLINLLSNAIKFTDHHGYVEFTVNILEETVNYVCIKFVVKDSGIGMTDDQVARLFKPFEQADSTIASRFGGTGLGLSISHSLVQKMGGSISIRSKPGEGSVFSFELLFKKGKISQAPTKDYKREMDFSGSRILLAEDIEINRYIVEELLTPLNLTIDEAVNGREAVEMFERAEPGHYKLIFMDLQMPELDGYGATRQIRGLARPDAQDIPIVAMTANAYKEDVEQVMAVGMNGHIGKPIDVDELMKILSTYLTDVSGGADE